MPNAAWLYNALIIVGIVYLTTEGWWGVAVLLMLCFATPTKLRSS